MTWKFKKGFTLIELLVVISIIGLLSSIILASLNNARVKARDVRRLGDMNSLRNALEIYYSTNNAYPVVTCDNGQYYGDFTGATGWAVYYPGFDTCWTDLQTQLAPYIPKLPVDPLNSFPSTSYNTPYNYGTWNGGKGYKLIMFPEQSAARGEGCFYPTEGWYCVGSAY